jgi:hypothetical protein
MALRPLANPKVGTYWRTDQQYDRMRPEAPKFVAVTKTTRGYAKMGLQECFVEFSSAYKYATMQLAEWHRLKHDIFMNIFIQISDEELGYELGLEILAHYDK